MKVKRFLAVVTIIFLVLAFCLFMPIIGHARINEKTYIPPQAFKFKPMIKSELEKYFPDIPTFAYIPSLIEHESCTSLTSPKCFNEKSRLKTSKEEGAGVGQITIAYDKNGNVRFDNIKEMRNKYKQDLAELTWATVYTRPDLQVRSLILMVRDMYGRIRNVPDSMERLKMTDAAYNGGERDMNRSRQVCYLTKGCNANVWFRNVELHCVKSKKILYDVRNACDINLFHVHNVFLDKLPKYTEYYKF